MSTSGHSSKVDSINALEIAQQHYNALKIYLASHLQKGTFDVILRRS